MGWKNYNIPYFFKFSFKLIPASRQYRKLAKNTKSVCCWWYFEGYAKLKGQKETNNVLIQCRLPSAGALVLYKLWKEDTHFVILHGVPGNVFECGCERNQVIRISWLLNECNDRCLERYNPILLAQPCELIRDRIYLFRKETL